MSKPLNFDHNHHRPRAMSCRNPLDDGRGRCIASRRRAYGGTGLDREAFMRRWSRLMMVSFATPEDCGRYFGAATRTVGYWYDGAHRPCGDQVALAALTLPRFTEIMGGQG